MSQAFKRNLSMSFFFQSKLHVAFFFITLQVTVTSPNRGGPYSTVLDNSFNRIGRALAGGSNDALVRSLFGHEVLRDLLITKVINIIDEECLALCRRSEPSII